MHRLSLSSLFIGFIGLVQMNSGESELEKDLNSKGQQNSATCMVNRAACRPDGSAGACCSNFCYTEPGWISGYCSEGLPKCLLEQMACRRDGFTGVCCSGFCYAEVGSALGYCSNGSPKCLLEGIACRPDGSAGACCSGFCYSEPSWVWGNCSGSSSGINGTTFSATNTENDTETATTNDKKNTSLIAGTVTSAVFIVLIAGSLVIVCRYRKLRTSRGNMKKRSGIKNDMDTIMLSKLLETAATGNERFDSLLIRYTKLMEVSRHTIEISDEILGKGEFGIVFKGSARTLPTVLRGPTTVAVKTIINSSDSARTEKFAEELKIMTKIGRNVNVISLLGIVIQENLLLLLEYCKYGNLLFYIRSHGTDSVYVHVDEDGNLQPFLESEMKSQWITSRKKYGKDVEEKDANNFMLSTNHLMKFAHQISRGMEYLVSRSIIHRDLAARNILVAENHVIKISDFGLAKHGQMDYMANMFVPLPVLWMPPEAILNGVFSQKSDVWSFGVLLWEIFSLGEVPFNRPNVAKFSPSAFAGWLLDGFQMERPSGTPLKIYEVMQQCWSLNPDSRPLFCELQKELDQLLSSTPEGSNYLTIQESNTLFTDEYEEILRSLSQIVTESPIAI